MKHPYFVGFLFVLFFLLTHFLGLYLLGGSIIVDDLGVVSFSDTVLGERPTLEGFESIIYVILGITMGTLILLFFAKNKKSSWWRYWFLFASALAMAVSINEAFNIAGFLLLFFSLGLASWKVFKPNMIIQNITEILSYAGISLVLIPLFSVTTMFIVLVLISIYDAYAVWKSKHMVVLAKFTRDAQLFPGFIISYSNPNSVVNGSSSFSKNSSFNNSENKKIGILGGGDVVFPLLFSGVIYAEFIKNGFSFNDAFLAGSVVSFCSALALFLLFLLGKKDKFYPAMPFLSVGCFFGYLLVLVMF